MHYPTLPQAIKDRAAARGIDVEASTEAFLDQIRSGRFCSPEVLRLVEKHHSDEPTRDLTPTEQRVFHLVMAGAGSQATADILGIAEKTVKQHRRNIYSKLGATNAPHAVTLYLVDLLERAEQAPLPKAA